MFKKPCLVSLKLLFLLMITFLLLPTNVSYADDNVIRLFVDKNEVYPDAPIIIQNERVLVPIRTIAKVTGAEIGWDEKTNKVTVKKGNLEVVLQVGQKEYTVSGSQRVFDVPPVINEGRTMIPLRSVAEAFGYKVEWLGLGRIVSIYTKDWPAYHSGKPEFIKVCELLFPDMELCDRTKYSYYWMGLSSENPKPLYRTFTVGELPTAHEREHEEIIFFLQSHPHVGIYLSEDSWWKFKVLLKMYFPDKYEKLYNFVRSAFERQSNDRNVKTFELFQIGDRQVLINGADRGPRLTVEITKPGEIIDTIIPPKKL